MLPRPSASQCRLQQRVGADGRYKIWCCIGNPLALHSAACFRGQVLHSAVFSRGLELMEGTRFGVVLAIHNRSLYAIKVGPFHNAKSVLCRGSTGIFIFFYCIYYYQARSDMSGFMQTSFVFSYTTCICYGFFLMLGTVGLCLFAVRVAHILGHRIFTADTSSVFKDNKYFKMEQSDISREIGWLDPSSTHQQEISSRIGRQGCETKHSNRVTEKKLLGKF
ncbi:hypothetical protein C4D60_Mb01t12070 [Musa balbisiana]|uniref:Transmembrane 9 superfamily member n=1 Tax=Musa balbisiana TaxID=52838 RepID=A0A4S8JMY7_MUSBA|nr:hypothetical protein C4D60_Mb01t12070 [Musa balbisiana]